MERTDIKLRMPVFDISFWLTFVIGLITIVFLYLYFPEIILPALLIIIVISLGVGLPRWIGRKTRNERAINAKLKETETWGFCSRDREGPWINYIDYPLIKMTEYASAKYFYSEWLIVHDGKIIVNPGAATVNYKDGTVEYDFSKKRTYAWDGCSPKRYFFWIALIGTPDWWQVREKIHTLSESNKIISKEVYWQRTLHASLVHDALYQYLDTVPISKQDVDQLFYEMLRDSGISWWLAKIYYLVVRYFGGRDLRQVNPLANSQLRVKNLFE